MKQQDLKEFVRNILMEKPETINSKQYITEREENPEDTINMDVPLFIRMLEYAREDASTDIDLHDIAEKAIGLSSEDKVLTMADYEFIVGDMESLDEDKKYNTKNDTPEIKALMTIANNTSNSYTERDEARQKAYKLRLKLNEDLDLGHEDNEPHMIKGELYRIGKYAIELYKMVDSFEGKGEVDFPAWWQSKVTTSMNNMVSAKHYLDFETKEPAIDAMVNIASDEEVIDENKIKMYYHVLEDGGYGRIGHQGYYDTPEEAQKRADTLSDMFPRSSFYVEAYPSKKEPVTVTMEEKKLTPAEKKKKEEIVKAMKKDFKGSKPAMYAIATDKAKDLAEIIAKKLMNND
jgi:hypothetical protein